MWDEAQKMEVSEIDQAGSIKQRGRSKATLADMVMVNE